MNRETIPFKTIMKYNSYRRTLIVVLDLAEPHMNHIGGVMVSVIASSAVDCGKILIGSNQRLELVYLASSLSTHQ